MDRLPHRHVAKNRGPEPNLGHDRSPRGEQRAARVTKRPRPAIEARPDSLELLGPQRERERAPGVHDHGNGGVADVHIDQEQVLFDAQRKRVTPLRRQRPEGRTGATHRGEGQGERAGRAGRESRDPVPHRQAVT
jgi:hypothetical protein